MEIYIRKIDLRTNSAKMLLMYTFFLFLLLSVLNKCIVPANLIMPQCEWFF